MNRSSTPTGRAEFVGDNLPVFHVEGSRRLDLVPESADGRTGLASPNAPPFSPDHGRGAAALRSASRD